MTAAEAWFDIQMFTSDIEKIPKEKIKKYYADQIIGRRKQVLKLLDKLQLVNDETLRKYEKTSNLVKIPTRSLDDLKKLVFKNVFIFGGTGTGKTHVTKYLIHRILEEKKVTHVKVVMVDANQSTARDILIQITDQYAYDYPKKPLRKVINTLKTYIDQSYKHNVIIIDNLQLIKSYKGDAVANLYRHLIDVQRNLRTSTVSFVFISNKRVKFLEGEERPEQAFSKGEMLLAGEDEGRPLLTPIQIIFGPYKAQELRDICKQRIQMGWVDLGGEEISNDLVDKMITGYENSGDARRCLLQVKDWLYDAHQEGLRKITHEFLDNVELEKRTQRTEESYVKETCSGLLKEQKMIIIALAQVMMNQNEEWIAYVDLKARTDTLLQERGMKISRTQFLRHTTYLKELELVDHSLEDNKSRYRLQIEPRPALEALKNVL